MSGVPIVPCPVRLGSVKTGGVAARLHQFTRERNLKKAEKLLKRGVDVDCVNHLGQTSLFCASLLGFSVVAELLLQYGADPNRRCDDRSTPVHAAVFSCNTRLLSALLEAGGDLRLHDDQGRTPRDWAEIGAQEHSARMVSFIKSCMSVMRSLSESQSPTERRVTLTSSKSLLRSPSVLDFLRPVSDVVFNKKVIAKSPTSDMVQCFGFGKLCVEKSVGVLASLPLLLDSELSQAEDEAPHSFPCGSFSKMTNYSWRGSRVTVKELQIDSTHQHAVQHGYLDLLVTELDFCCRLFHPHILQLMAVSSSNHLQQSKLVYERVHVGSLYTLLYHRRAEFPVLQVYEVLSLILQVCEALSYLHSRSLVLRSLSSHSVLVVHPGVAKVTDLGFMVPSDCSSSSTLPVPAMLYNWAAPEVIRRKACTGKADLYSICALVQELYTDAVPWGSVNPCWIKQAVDAGQALFADPAVPQPYYDLLLNGLKPSAQERTCSLQDLRYTLRFHLRELSERERSEMRPLQARSSPHRRSRDIRKNRDSAHPDEQQVVDKVNHDQLRELDSFLENQTIQKNYLRNLQNEATEFCTSSDTVLRDISFWDTVPLDESHLSSRPSSVEEEDTEEERTKSSICNNISSTVLNLKVSQLLLQQVESSLDKFESRMMGNTCSDIPQFDEPDGRRDRQVVMLKAAGPPSYNYIPSVMRQEMEEVTEFCSAGEESLESSEADKNISQRDRRTRGGQEQAVRFTEECDGLYQSSAACTSQELTQTQRAEHNWTSEVSTAVAWMTRGFLSCAAGALVESSDSEEEQPQCPLMDAEEALFKSFAVVHSESEDSTDFHTMNHTFTLPNAVYEIKGQHREEDGSDSDYAQSPLELSSIFYTPKHNPDNTHAKEELSQKPNSEDDPDVTMEVCRPDMTVQTTFRECRSSPEEPEHTETESAPPSVHTTRSSHMADIADLSSITCSPAQLQEWVGQNEARTSPHSTHFPPCNSTPRSPHTHTAGRGRSAPHREAVCVSPLVPHLQSLMETSPWGSAESPSHTESYNMARLECTDTVHWSVPESFPQGDSDTPSSCNLEFTTVSSGVRHSEEKKSQDHGDTAALECDTEKDGSLEEAKRAHSTLDEVLQGLMENTEAQRTMRGAAVITDVSAGSDQEEERVFGQSVSAERGICRQLEEEEILEEDYSCSRGDAGEGVATRGTKKKTLSSKVSGSDMEKLV